MFKLLRRIPVDQRKGVAGGLISAVTLCVPFAFLMYLSYSETSEEKCTGHLAWKKCHDVAIPMSDRLPDLLIAIGLIFVAMLCAIAALVITTAPKDGDDDYAHLRRYIAILHGHESMSVLQIASITGTKADKVRAEIQKMIDSAMITDYYLDVARDMVVSKKYIPSTSHKTVISCPSCQAHTEVIVGIPAPCSFCRKPLILRHPS